tara:strand:+ start:113 stop:448 length:336 start_codon:yes stop_codon:yes gene_type:complete
MFETIFNAYLEFWIKATDFKSKTTLSDWWWIKIINLLISLLTLPIFFRVFGFNVYGIICIVPEIAIDIRRLNDYGKDWKWIFINIVPVFGWILWFIWLGFGQSGKGNNKFI